MQNNYAIEVKNITKKFKVYLDKGNTLKEKMLFRSRRKYEERIVLNNISFNVKKGEAIGLIGHNGCGKSTTLKLLTKIMYPDTGTIEMRGRVSSLIELGAGFHPDMSGRQNIYTNASIFGLTRKEIDRRLEDIIAFSELEDFIDNPVRTYSSGMYTRLAFAVAINVDADILLIDEILAVGDANFQAKCFNKMKEIKAQGTTIVIVSHVLNQIEQICDRSLWIDGGKICLDGKPSEVHRTYLEYMGVKEQESLQKEKRRQEQKKREMAELPKEKNEVTESSDNVEKILQHSHEDADEGTEKRWGNRFVEFTDIEMLDENGISQLAFSTGENIEICMQYKVHKPITGAVIGIGIFRVDGLQCYGTNLLIDKLHLPDLKYDGIQKVLLKKVNLLPGEYFLDVAIENEFGVPIDYFRNAVKFCMHSVENDVGVFRIDHDWLGNEEG